MCFGDRGGAVRQASLARRLLGAVVDHRATYEALTASIFAHWVKEGDAATEKPRLPLSGNALFGGVWMRHYEDEIRSVEGPREKRDEVEPGKGLSW